MVTPSRPFISLVLVLALGGPLGSAATVELAYSLVAASGRRLPILYVNG